MEQISVPLELKAAKGDTGHFEGYGAVFNNIDHGDDIILPDAFKSVRKTNDGKVRIALYHDLRQLVGKAEYSQDDHGLHLKGQLNMDVSYAKDAYHLMKDGTLDGMSVGFNILKGGAEWSEGDDDRIVRVISKAELWEVSIVPFGMNAEALLTEVKAAIDIHDHKSFEAFLRENGFSRKEATAIASGGFGALQRDAGGVSGSLSDSGELTSEMLATYKNAIAAFNI